MAPNSNKHCICDQRISDILQKVSAQGTQIDPKEEAFWGNLPMATYQSLVEPAVPWLEGGFVEQGFVLSEEMKCFWNHTNKVKIFCEIPYGQWGTILFGAEESLRKTKEWKEIYPEEFVLGDLVIGEFLGDAQFVVMRCNQEKEDWGQVVIGFPIDVRAEWPNVAGSVAEFVEKTLASPDMKYWETRF